MPYWWKHGSYWIHQTIKHECAHWGETISKGIIGVPVVLKELAVCGSMLQKHHILVNTRKEIEFKVTCSYFWWPTNRIKCLRNGPESYSGYTRLTAITKDEITAFQQNVQEKRLHHCPQNILSNDNLWLINYDCVLLMTFQTLLEHYWYVISCHIHRM